MTDAAAHGSKSSALEKFGPLDSCRGVIRAYEKYRYNLFKEKYCDHGTIKGQFGNEKRA